MYKFPGQSRQSSGSSSDSVPRAASPSLDQQGGISLLRGEKYMKAGFFPNVLSMFPIFWVSLLFRRQFSWSESLHSPHSEIAMRAGSAASESNISPLVTVLGKENISDALPSSGEEAGLQFLGLSSAGQAFTPQLQMSLRTFFLLGDHFQYTWR